MPLTPGGAGVGEVALVIMGGMVYDPAEEARKKNAVRKLSDRPGRLAD